MEIIIRKIADGLLGKRMPEIEFIIIIKKVYMLDTILAIIIAFIASFFLIWIFCWIMYPIVFFIDWVKGQLKGKRWRLFQGLSR
jgi:hypothetical protein